jgi:hypothetical protein
MFYPHDEAPINFRRVTFTCKCWVMLLGYPLDLKDFPTLVEVCTPFAKVLHWNASYQSLSRVLLKLLVEDPLEIPKSVVIKFGRESDGEGRSWTVPIYIFNSNLVNADPAEEEDPPAENGNPHPSQGPVLPGEIKQVRQMADDFIANLPHHVAPDEESNADTMVIVDEDTVQGSGHNDANHGDGQLVASSGDLAWNRTSREDCAVHLVRDDKKKEQTSENLSMFQVTKFLAACNFKIISSCSAEDNSQGSVQITLPCGAAITINLPMTKACSDGFVEEVGEGHTQVPPEDLSASVVKGALPEPNWTANNQKITSV